MFIIKNIFKLNNFNETKIKHTLRGENVIKEINVAESWICWQKGTSGESKDTIPHSRYDGA